MTNEENEKKTHDNEYETIGWIDNNIRVSVQKNKFNGLPECALKSMKDVKATITTPDGKKTEDYVPDTKNPHFINLSPNKTRSLNELLARSVEKLEQMETS